MRSLYKNSPLTTKLKITILLILFLLTGCASPTPTPDIQSTLVAISTATLVAPVMTVTPTVEHSLPTKTPLPTEPLPILSSSEKMQLINLLKADDYLCTLPCWGGIEPGVTTWPQARDFLQQVAQINYYRFGIAAAEYLQNGELSTLGFFYSENDIVEFIYVSRDEYPISRLVKEYGQPDEIYFFILDILPIDKTNPYTIYFFYKQAGIMAEFNGKSSPGEKLNVCFGEDKNTNAHSTPLSLWSKNSGKGFHEISTQYLDKIYNFSSSKYYRLEDVSEMTVKGFFEAYSHNEFEQKCLEIRNPNVVP